MFTRPWRRRKRKSDHQKRRAKPRTYVPRMEVLEGRWAPAALICWSVEEGGNGHCYGTTDAGSWTQSKTDAASRGGHLVTIDNAAEQEFIQSKFLSGTDDFWIGLTSPSDNVTDLSSWKWVSGSASTYRNWATGQPDAGPDDGDADAYAAINFSGDPKWHNYPNSAFRMPQGIYEVDGTAETLNCRMIQDGSTLTITGDVNGDSNISIFDDPALNLISVDCNGTTKDFPGIEQLLINTGTGNDTVTFDVAAPYDGRTRDIAVTLGAGDDSLTFDANDVQGGSNISVLIQGGPGLDVVTGDLNDVFDQSTFSWDAALGKHQDVGGFDFENEGVGVASEVSIKMDGGGGGDSLVIRARDAVVDGSFLVTLIGGAGNDVLKFDALPGNDQPPGIEIDGTLRLILQDGTLTVPGDGDDSIVVDLRILAGSTGTLNMRLRGRDDDDELFAALVGFQESSLQLSGALSAGPGLDKCTLLGFDKTLVFVGGCEPPIVNEF